MRILQCSRIICLIASGTLTVASFSKTVLPNQREAVLARHLADQSTRSATIGKIVGSGTAKLPVLLNWTKSPPPGVNVRELNLALVELFGRLHATEAIPFLIANINFRDSPVGSIWMKSPEDVIHRSPAIRALLAIGPDAIPSLTQAYSKATPMDRLAIVLTLSEMKDVRAKNVLFSAFGFAEQELSYAKRGLAFLGERVQGKIQ